MSMEERYDKGEAPRAEETSAETARSPFGPVRNRIEDFLDNRIRGSKFSWGLVLLLAVAAYAVFNIFSVFIRLFN